MHGKVDLENIKGLKKSEIRRLNRLLQERLPVDKILTVDLAETVAELSFDISYPISLVVDRSGQVVNVTVGRPSDVKTPELRGVRVGPGRLCGQRIIYTTLPARRSSPKSQNGRKSFSKEDLQCLARNRLDLLARIHVDPEAPFSRRRGHQVKYADVVQYAHLLPGRDSEGRLWKEHALFTARQLQSESLVELIAALEDEFRKEAPAFPVADGEERAMLAAVISHGTDPFQVEDDLDELSQLARTAGATVCGRITQSRWQPDPRHYLGSGKVEELALLVQEKGANLVIVDEELNPNQQRIMEEIVAVKVIDRTELILDIFAQRAHTKEGNLQVELAQLKYLYPRLVGKGLSLSRLGGGIATRGPGETKLEVDRRRIEPESIISRTKPCAFAATAIRSAGAGLLRICRKWR